MRVPKTQINTPIHVIVICPASTLLRRQNTHKSHLWHLCNRMSPVAEYARIVRTSYTLALRKRNLSDGGNVEWCREGKRNVEGRVV